MTNYSSGSQRRAINRKGNIYTVAKSALDKANSEADLQHWLQHKNSRIRLLAFSYAIKLANKLPEVVDNSYREVQEKSPFDLLVERFTKEGKKDPVKSARASLAASARKNQKDTHRATDTQLSV
jgi:hypothetical protein